MFSVLIQDTSWNKWISVLFLGSYLETGNKETYLISNIRIFQEPFYLKRGSKDITTQDYWKPSLAGEVSLKDNWVKRLGLFMAKAEMLRKHHELKSGLPVHLTLLRVIWVFFKFFFFLSNCPIYNVYFTGL